MYDTKELRVALRFVFSRLNKTFETKLVSELEVASVVEKAMAAAWSLRSSVPVRRYWVGGVVGTEVEERTKARL
jgi:hypothetical protein